MAELRKYGIATTILFPLITRDAVDYETGASPSGSDVQIMKDEGAFTNVSVGAATHEGNGMYSVALSATEMSAARIIITIIDSATKVWEDQAVLIETYGNASAQHAFDLNDAEPDVNLVNWRGTTPWNLSGGKVQTHLASISATAKAEINAEVDMAFADYNPPTKAEMDSAHALLATAAALTTVDIEVGVIDEIVDAILLDTGVTIPALIAALNDLSAEEVNAEVDDALDTAIPADPTADSVNERLKRLGTALTTGKFIALQ